VGAILDSLVYSNSHTTPYLLSVAIENSLISTAQSYRISGLPIVRIYANFINIYIMHKSEI